MTTLLCWSAQKKAKQNKNKEEKKENVKKKLKYATGILFYPTSQKGTSAFTGHWQQLLMNIGNSLATI